MCTVTYNANVTYYVVWFLICLLFLISDFLKMGKTGVKSKGLVHWDTLLLGDREGRCYVTAGSRHLANGQSLGMVTVKNCKGSEILPCLHANK